MASILLIDDDEVTDILRNDLETLGHSVHWLDRADEAPALQDAGRFDIVVLDNQMPRITGIEFLADLRKRGIEIPVILMTAHGTSETAIRAEILKVFDYVIKPGSVQELAPLLQPMIKRAMEIKPPTEVHVPGQRPPARSNGPEMVGNSKAMRDVYTRIGQFADLNDSILILGETGTGKELAARAFHTFSSRKDKPFIALNCTAFTESLQGSELFGHEKGAFTGADKLRKGMIEHANGGTLFLDEIGDMPLALQVQLLRVLQERQIQRVGGSELIDVNFRLISATHRDLRAEIKKETFRSDLFYRLNVTELRLPPLRERLEDLSKLAEYFLARAAAEAGRASPALAPATVDRLRDYRWPGNVRELEDVISHAFGVCRGPEILPQHIEFRDHSSGEAPPTAEADALAGLRNAIDWAWNSNQPDLWPLLRDLLERELLKVAIERLDGNQTQIAKRIKMARGTVIERMETYGLK